MHLEQEKDRDRLPGSESLLIGAAATSKLKMARTDRPTILLVEDETDLRELIAESLESSGFEVTASGTGADAAEKLREFPFDGLVMDLRLPDTDGMTVLEGALETYPELVAVVITGFGSVSDAVHAIKRGAKDFLIKPFEIEKLSHILTVNLEHRELRLENAELRAQLQDKFKMGGLIGRSEAMRRLSDTLELIAPTSSTILLEGETGTGKEMVARTIHHNSPRSGQRLIAFNAAAIPEPLAEAELFGHAKGAFTGAVSSRVGRFELAHRGTLFIDEVGLMSLPLQAKLLRALQEREIERVGENRAIKFDARVIAATNTDLGKLVKDGTFREDLYYRLNVIRIPLPALRERRDDIPLLARHFVKRACGANGLALRTVTQEALRYLMAHHWPGNVRQLENAMEHAVAMSGKVLDLTTDYLPKEIVGQGEPEMVPSMTIPEEGINLNSVVGQVERELILRCLERTGGNKRQAARLLQLSRTTLIDKLNRFGNRPASVA
jgi:DNA-binding NtrC family response regulator